MSLKTITLLAATFGMLALCGSIYHFIGFVARGNLSDNVDTMITWPLGILAEGSLVCFLYVLFFKQRSKP